MKKFITTFFVILTLLTGCEKDDYQKSQKHDDNTKLAERVDGRVALAYVTYYGTAIPDPACITHINYAFAELYVVNGVYKGFKLEGDVARFQKIVDLKKQNPDLKICISFTHTVSNADNAQGGGFSALAKSDEYRKSFALDCKAFLVNWNLDGVDIDWEFPGISWSGHACDPSVDVQNYTLLMKQLRETLGSNYLLTYAGYVQDMKTTTGGYKYIDVSEVNQYVDFVNLMTYDISEAPKHQSALYNSNADWDCERTVNEYINAGVPANKLVLGIPFYGRHSFSLAPTAINYRDIILLDSRTYKIDNWDNIACVPYVTKDGTYYCGYDNSRSIALKGEWVLSRGMKGMMFWDYDGDDAAGTLRRSIWEAVMKN
jgi:chitinase